MVKFVSFKTLFISLIVFTACSHPVNNDSEDGSKINESEKELINDNTSFAYEFADSIFNSLTLEERIGQCLMPAISSDTSSLTLTTYKKYIEDLHVGGVVLMKGDRESVVVLSEIGAKLKVPLFISIDAEWGLGMRLSDAPVYPKNGRIAVNAEETLLYDYGREIARESRDYGINMILGPVVDVSSRHGNVIGERSFGSDPERVANLGISYAKGLESGGVLSVAKHFPGHGNSLHDSHKYTAINHKAITVLDSMDFYPFKKYIDSGLSGIMAGHIWLPSVSKTNIPASVSEEILTTLLREEMGFRGLVITDAFNMGGAHGYHGWEALKAGADIILSPSDPAEEIVLIKNKIETGELDSRIIDDRCRRILFYKTIFELWTTHERQADSDDRSFIEELNNRLRGKEKSFYNLELSR